MTFIEAYKAMQRREAVTVNAVDEKVRGLLVDYKAPYFIFQPEGNSRSKLKTPVLPRDIEFFKERRNCV